MAERTFDVDSLARYLHLTPHQVLRMAERGRLPGRKVGGRWRFTQPEIHHWLEERIGACDQEELDQVDRVLAAPDHGSPQRVSIAELLPLEAIAVSLPARTRASAIASMVQLAAGTGLLWDPDKMEAAVRARENLHPTALDNGVALLHPRRPLAAILAEPFLAFGRTQQGIPFGGAALTDLFFLICSTDDRGHLRTLARLSRLLANDALLDELRKAEDAASVKRLFVQYEAELDR